MGHPLMAALDKDKDGALSGDEITAAAESLKSLDTNGDGKLAEDELRPPRPPRGPGEGFGRGPRGDFAPRRRGRPDGPPPPEDFPRGPRAGGPPDGPPPGDRHPRRDPREGDREDVGRGPRVLPPGAREHLDLSDDQNKQLDALEAEVREKLEDILEPEQLERLGEMFRRGPGRRGPGFGGPPDGPPGSPDGPRPPRPPRGPRPPEEPEDD
jgi:hypothetical protein